MKARNSNYWTKGMTATVADNANVALYATFAPVGFFAGTVVNRLGKFLTRTPRYQVHNLLNQASKRHCPLGALATLSTSRAS